MSDELRLEFHQELAAIRAEVVVLTRIVIGAIPRATSILVSGDLEGADYLIRWDDEIDARTLDLEERCTHILALQAPVASDLRLVLAVIRIIIEVERSADLLVNICKAARRIYSHPLNDSLQRSIEAMGDQARQLYEQAIDAFERDDEAVARAVDANDDNLDALQKDFIQLIFQSHAADSIDLPIAVQLAVIARFYERIGDHAVNIAERVRFMVTGWLPEHKGAARYRAAHQAHPVATDPAAVDR